MFRLSTGPEVAVRLGQDISSAVTMVWNVNGTLSLEYKSRVETPLNDNNSHSFIQDLNCKGGKLKVNLSKWTLN